MDRFSLATLVLIGIAMLYLLSQPAATDSSLHALPTAAQPTPPSGPGFDLAFTAVDGTVVDVSKMRGKVVLVDFWATWCPPCREEVPNVVAAYNKYHDKGFEVVGVSLDQDRDELNNFTQQSGMVWPQYFDGQGWDNAISTRFGIHSIPAMWLIGKNGQVITQDAREDLAANVEAALAQP